MAGSLVSRFAAEARLRLGGKRPEDDDDEDDEEPPTPPPQVVSETPSVTTEKLSASLQDTCPGSVGVPTSFDVPCLEVLSNLMLLLGNSIGSSVLSEVLYILSVLTNYSHDFAEEVLQQETKVPQSATDLQSSFQIISIHFNSFQFISIHFFFFFDSVFVVFMDFPPSGHLQPHPPDVRRRRLDADQRPHPGAGSPGLNPSLPAAHRERLCLRGAPPGGLSEASRLPGRPEQPLIEVDGHLAGLDGPLGAIDLHLLAPHHCVVWSRAS